MPEVLTPDLVEFQLHDGASRLQVTVPAPTPAGAEGWRFLNRATVCVLDGPEQAGYLMPRLAPDGDAAPIGWDEAVATTGGVTVTFGTRHPDAVRTLHRRGVEPAPADDGHEARARHV